jgi:hypothetical protein
MCAEKSKQKTWHITLNAENSHDKVILDYFNSQNTSLTQTAAVKEFLYVNINNLNRSDDLSGVPDSGIHDKLDYIIELIKNKSLSAISPTFADSEKSTVNLSDEIKKFEENF